LENHALTIGVGIPRAGKPTVGLWIGSGIQIISDRQNSDTLVPVAKALALALSGAGIAATFAFRNPEYSTISAERIAILIGQKPNEP
jgi:hypothetical protein